MKKHSVVIRDPISLTRAMNWLSASLDRQPGVALKMTLEDFRAKRTKQRNKRLWALYNYISDAVLEGSGELWPAEDIHDQLKRRILGMESSAIGERPRGTADMPEDPFEQYMQHVQRISASEWHVDWSDWGKGDAKSAN